MPFDAGDRIDDDFLKRPPVFSVIVGAEDEIIIRKLIMPKRVRKYAKIGISNVIPNASSSLEENARYSLIRMVGVTPMLAYWLRKNV